MDSVRVDECPKVLRPIRSLTAPSVDEKSPTHSPNGADTRLSRFLGSGRITGNPHLTRRWPFERVTEGLPTNKTRFAKEANHFSDIRVTRPGDCCREERIIAR